MAENNRTHAPGALTARRFFRNPLAVTGLGILLFLFLFSFPGGLLIPYRQDQVFYREELLKKPVAAVTENRSYRLTPVDGPVADPVLEAQLTLALASGEETLIYGDTLYRLYREGRDFFGIYQGERRWGMAGKDMLLSEEETDFQLRYEALRAYTGGETTFSAGGASYRIEGDTVYLEGQPVGMFSRLLIRPAADGGSIDAKFRQQVGSAIEENRAQFESGTRQYSLSYDASNMLWSVEEQTVTRVWDSYRSPSLSHPLGTDKNGMDMLTRLMYGGRVSLIIGFSVVLLAGLLGVVLGGVSGYFGGIADEAVMRLTDVFYCIPTTPVLIILGAATDALRVDPRLRLVLMILILGVLGWPDIARLVRGQILSLREQDFMVAAEAAGLPARIRIFRHLIPNVTAQLIAICTLRLGSAILTEATLSFLGLGVKFPFASWGNIMNDVGNVHVLTSYWFVWIPAGVCLMLAVLGFNFAGDGLRDALDPK